MSHQINGKVIPLRKSNHYGVFTGETLSSGEVIEKHQVGSAFLKPGSNKFRLKLYMFPSLQYFVLPNDEDPKKYEVVSLEEYEVPGQGKKTSWNKVGEGTLTGVFITLRLHLIAMPLYLSLYPMGRESTDDPIAS